MITLLQSLASGTTDLEADINALSIQSVMIASLILVVLLVIASQVVNNKKYEIVKTPLFIAIAATIIIPSLLMMGSTVYVNTVSESGGPVHWHTDIEFWVCGQEVELRDPSAFLSNKIGTSTYHEHDDKRIHLEGVVIEKEYDASLQKFMDVTGGEISTTTLLIPTEDTIFENDVDGDVPRGDESIVQSYVVRDEEGLPQIAVDNSKTCDDGQSAEVQAFLFRYEKSDDTYTQVKLENPAAYIMRDESIVPPGDCLIVEFDSPKNSTDRLCKQYGVRDSERCTEFGVSNYNPELCNIREIISDEPLPEPLEEAPVEAIVPLENLNEEGAN